MNIIRTTVEGLTSLGAFGVATDKFDNYNAGKLTDNTINIVFHILNFTTVIC